MKFNTKVRYGIRAMMEIAKGDPEHGVLQKEIAENQEISFKYLDVIISSLKVAGLITSVSGKKSGYRLTRKPEDINMLDIYEAFEPEMLVNDCVNESFDCSRREMCGVVGFWSGLNKMIIDYFSSTSLTELYMKEELKKQAQ